MPKSIWTKPYREMLRRLKAARVAAGLSQTAVAEDLGWGQSAVSKVERGERRLDPIELQTLARHYKTTVGALLGEDIGPPDRRRASRRARRSGRP